MKDREIKSIVDDYMKRKYKFEPVLYLYSFTGVTYIG